MSSSRIFLISGLLGLTIILSGVVWADTYVSGTQSGTWTAAGSPYIVTGHITVPTGLTLAIEAGVEVLFRGTYQIYTNGGIIHALGSPEDSIYFMPDAGYTQWGSIRMEFTAVSNPSIFKYCHFEHGDGSPLYDRRGGALNVNYGSIIVKNCSFWYNSAYTGATMFAAFSNITIDSCGMYYGQSEWCQGALGFHGCIGTVSYTTMSHNYCPAWGGGVYAWEGNMSFDHCTITNNTAGQVGGGLVVYPPGTTTLVDNCIIWGNNGGNIYSPGNAVITYSDIGGGWPGTGNINADPMFVNAAGDDYHLQQGSPCIDAGNPASPLDPDGTRSDMGAYYFDQSGGPMGNLTLYLDPVNPPIILPPQGGPFDYTATIYCDPSNYAVFDAWADLLLPDGQVMGPLYIRPNIFLAAGDSLFKQLQMYVSAWAMPGTYEFRVYLGHSPDSVYASDFFTFVKLPLGGNAAPIEPAYAVLSGWDLVEKVGLPGTDLTQSSSQGRLALKNAPEPFNPETSFRFDLPSRGWVKLKIYALSGRLAATLLDREMEAGAYEQAWNASQMPSGIYLAKLSTSAGEVTERCLLVK